MSEVGGSGHWNEVYSTRREDGVSWFEDTPDLSLRLIDRSGIAPDAPFIDVGGGASRLVDRLLERGFTDVTVLDLSSRALDNAKSRLGDAASKAGWVVADVSAWRNDRTYGIWHDRAAFHFLTETAAREAYLATLRQAVAPGGFAIFGVFAPDGPATCSGLPVMRYDARQLAQLLGSSFELLHQERHAHKTPWSVEQKFQFALFRRSS
jgi:trans-aconitate methyltransferase